MESRSESADGNNGLGNDSLVRVSSNHVAHVSSQWTFRNARLHLTICFLTYRPSGLLLIFQL